MRKVVDSNFLQDTRLREYLSASPQNYAVLTDYAAMEAYKGDTLNSIFASMQILSEYPKQVIVLKGTQFACGMRGRKSGLQRRLIDPRQTKGFAEYCGHLAAAKQGNKSLQKQILDLGREATTHIDIRMLNDAKDLPEVFDDMTKLFTESELRILRTHESYTDDIREKHTQAVLEIAAKLFRDHPKATQPPNAEELPYTFIFRVAVCGYLLFIRWAATGGQRKIRPEKLRNDMVDVNFAAFATYFDGLLTADKRLLETYKTASIFIQSLCEPA